MCIKYIFFDINFFWRAKICLYSYVCEIFARRYVLSANPERPQPVSQSYNFSPAVQVKIMKIAKINTSPPARWHKHFQQHNIVLASTSAIFSHYQNLC